MKWRPVSLEKRCERRAGAARRRAGGRPKHERSHEYRGTGLSWRHSLTPSTTAMRSSLVQPLRRRTLTGRYSARSIVCPDGCGAQCPISTRTIETRCSASCVRTRGASAAATFPARPREGASVRAGGRAGGWQGKRWLVKRAGGRGAEWTARFERTDGHPRAEWDDLRGAAAGPDGAGGLGPRAARHERA